MNSLIVPTLFVNLNGIVDPEPQYTPPKWNDAWKSENALLITEDICREIFFLP